MKQSLDALQRGEDCEFAAWMPDRKVAGHGAFLCVETIMGVILGRIQTPTCFFEAPTHVTWVLIGCICKPCYPGTGPME